MGFGWPFVWLRFLGQQVDGWSSPGGLHLAMPQAVDVFAQQMVQEMDGELHHLRRWIDPNKVSRRMKVLSSK